MKHPNYARGRIIVRSVGSGQINFVRSTVSFDKLFLKRVNYEPKVAPSSSYFGNGGIQRCNNYRDGNLLKIQVLALPSEIWNSSFRSVMTFFTHTLLNLIQTHLVFLYSRKIILTQMIRTLMNNTSHSELKKIWLYKIYISSGSSEVSCGVGGGRGKICKIYISLV